MANSEELGLTRHTRRWLETQLPRPIKGAFTVTAQDLDENAKLRRLSLIEGEKTDRMGASQDRNKRRIAARKAYKERMKGKCR